MTRGPVFPQVNLATNQYLFSVSVSPSEMPCICLRHDVDGLVWQPRPRQPDGLLEHVATFNALGKTPLNLDFEANSRTPQTSVMKKMVPGSRRD